MHMNAINFLVFIDYFRVRMVNFNKIVLFISLIFTYPAFGISISVSSNCNNGAIPYNFDEFAYDSDIKIKFSSYAINPDYTFKEVTSKYVADIVVEDNIDGDFSVCKSYRGKTIKILDYEYGTDFTIKISKYKSFSDYTIFNDSKILTTEEAISIILLQGFEDLYSVAD